MQVKKDRRSLAALAASLPALARRPAPGAAAAAGQPPNVVVFVMDDMRATDWKALPRIRALVGMRGRIYPNFILNTPICGPSRATLFTGRLPGNHGVMENDENDTQSWNQMNRGVGRTGTLHHAAQRRGYRTGLFGKFLNGAPLNGPISPGLDRWSSTSGQRYVNFSLNENGEAVRYGKGAYLTDVLARQAVEFVETTPRDHPFLLYFTPKAPKGPSTPSRRFAGSFNGTPLERTPAFNEADVNDKPMNARRKPLLSAPEIAKLQELEQDRLETLRSVDAAFVRIWRAVRRTGRGANTIVMVMTDNGYSMGDHRIAGKGQPYDAMIRVPMMAYGPGFTRGTDRRLAAMYDVAPTLAQAMGLEMAGVDGASLLDPWTREYVPLQVPGTWMPFWGLRGERELYVEYWNGEREYYDHRTDPWEMENMIITWDGLEPTLDEATQRDLARRLAQFRVCQGPACRGIS